MNKLYLTLLFVITLLVTTSCDRSFDMANPLGYDKDVSKVEGNCLTHTDCESLSCDTTTKKCNPDPCEGVDCSGHGSCEVNDGLAECRCNKTDDNSDYNHDDKGKEINYFHFNKDGVIDKTQCIADEISGCDDAVVRLSI